MSKQTALQELKQWVDDNYPNFNKADIEAKIDDLLPKERQDIIDAHTEGQALIFSTVQKYFGRFDKTKAEVEKARNWDNDVNALDYFTQTYNQK